MPSYKTGCIYITLEPLARYYTPQQRSAASHTQSIQSGGVEAVVAGKADTTTPLGPGTELDPRLWER